MVGKMCFFLTEFPCFLVAEIHNFDDFMALGLALDHFGLQGWILGQNTLRKSIHFGSFLDCFFR